MSTGHYEHTPRRRALKRVTGRMRRVRRALESENLTYRAKRALNKELNSLKREHKSILEASTTPLVTNQLAPARTASPRAPEELTPRRQALKRITGRLRRVQARLDGDILTDEERQAYLTEQVALQEEHAQVRADKSAVSIDFDAFDASQFLTEDSTLDYASAHAYTERAISDSIPRLSSAINSLVNLLVRNGSKDEGVITSLIVADDVAGLDSYIEERTSKDIFLEAVRVREALKSQITTHKALNDVMKQSVESTDADHEGARLCALIVVDMQELFQLTRTRLDEYRSITAFAVQSVTELRQAEQMDNGTFVSYDDDTLGPLVSLGEFPSGSREWLESRQGGIGGSDVGAILRVDPEYAYDNFREVFWSKVDQITDDQMQIEEHTRSGMTTAVGRGNAWEEEVLHRFTLRNPDIRVAHCKTSWKNKDRPYQYANFDGLMLSSVTGEPDGIVEIKTGSDPSKWGSPEEGLYGVPLQYRAQVLWYMHAAGFKRGAIAVVLDDHEYREYHFEITPELEEEQESNLKRAMSFWSDIKDAKTNRAPYLPKKRRDGFSMTALKGTYRAKERIFNDLAVYREETVDQVVARFDELVEDHRDPELCAEGLWTMYAEFDPASRTKNIIGVDIETNSLSPRGGRIIELGVSVRDNKGKEIKKIARLHGISKRAKIGMGTGAEDIHGISMSDIEGKDPFSEPRYQERLLETFKSGILVAHNAIYEDNWFRVHLRGYAEARDNGEIQIIDTMVLSRNLIPGMDNHKLESFVKYNGFDYVDAHRAYNDTAMMCDALFAFTRNLHATYLQSLYESVA